MQEVSPTSPAFSDAKAHNAPSGRLPPSVPWSYVFVFLTASAFIAGLTWYSTRTDYRGERGYWLAQLSGVADVRAKAVSRWLRERQADADVLASLPSVRVLLGGERTTEIMLSRPRLRRQLAPLLERFISVYRYSGIYVVDTTGKAVIQAAGSPSGAARAREASQAAAERRGLRIDLVGESPQTSYVSFSLPVFAHEAAEMAGPASRRILGGVVLQIPLSNTIFPILGLGSIPSDSGETLLVRREANEIVYFSPPRHESGLSGQLRRLLESPGLAARNALVVGESAGEFRDYRGVRVVAATCRIPETGWGLVAKIDRDEALVQFNRMALLKALLAGAAMLLFGVSLRAYRRTLLARSLQNELEKQQAVLTMRRYAQEVVDSVPAGLLVLSADLRVLSANSFFLEHFNLKQDEVVGRRLEDLVRADTPPYRVSSPLEGEVVPETVLLNVSVVGREEKWPARIILKKLAHEAEDGRFLFVVEDQTASERLRGVAESSERRLRDLIQSLDAVVWEADTATLRFSFVSQRAEQILGYPVEQWLGDPDFFVRHLHPDDQEAVLALRRLAVAEGKFSESEFRMLAADGHIVWFHEKVRVVGEAEERPRQIRGVMVDITESKRTAEERAHLSSAVEQAGESVLITDPEGNIVYVNPAFERLTGYQRGEVTGKNPRILKSGKQDRKFYQRLWDTLLRGEVWSGCFHNQRKDGTLYEAEAVISPVRNAAGRVVNYVAVQRDVTRERQLEEQLRQAQKMEAIGRLAGGIAHDFNNLLTIINGYGQLLMERASGEEPLSSQLSEIRKAADRAASLTRQLLAFSRRQVLAPRVLDLNGVVAGMGKMLRRLIGEDIHLLAGLDPELGRVKADLGQIEQVILNLAVNARDAMPQGGKLTIETSNAYLDEAYSREHFNVKAGRYVMLAVGDNGCGMDAETQSHIFEPFFTTKEVGKGTGLGLAMVYGIVKQSGGYIWVYSELGQGTMFKIYLPRVEGVPKEARALETPAARAQRGETILLVEDEGALRVMVCGVLESRGYRVVEARNGTEALVVGEQHEGPIHLLVTDVVMPEISGPKLAERLAVLHREMKVLYMSGYTDEAIVHHGMLDTGAAFLQKPFAPDELARKAREVLDAPPQGTG